MKTKSILTALLSLFAVYTLVFQGCYKDSFNCEARFHADTTDGMAPLLVNFIDESYNGPESWHWEFGDGDISMLQNPSHTYNQPGEYTVSLTVNKPNYDPDTETKEYYIDVDSDEPPTADFYADTTSGIAPVCIVNFFDQSTNATIWMWTFGDGGISNQQNPSHTYIDAGEFTVTLYVSNASGVTDTETKEFYIYVSEGESFTDPRDGQTYYIRDIGSQRWFIENLNYETTSSSWYDNNSANGDLYGRLYNWDDALTACPEGWHLPSDDEWKILEMHLGMSQSDADSQGIRNSGDVGLKMKSTSGWDDLNGTNSSGFSAYPGGYSYYQDFGYLGTIGTFWTATETSSSEAWYRYLDSANGIYRYDYLLNKEISMSVRCVMDQTK